MIALQVIARGDQDAYKMLRRKVTNDAATWEWANRGKTRLRHKGRPKGGYIEIGGVGGVLLARIHPKHPGDLFYLAEKFTGRLVAWFEDDLTAINIQFLEA